MDEPKEKREWKTRLAGVTFEGRMENIERYAMANSRYRLVRQPDNKFDTKAIQVTANGHDIGFLPSYLSQELAPIMDSGIELNVHFRRALVNEKKGEIVGLIVRIWE